MSVETWSIGAGRWVTYTDDRAFFSDLLTIKGVEKRATYMQGPGLRSFAWDAVYPSALRGKVSRAISRFQKGNF